MLKNYLGKFSNSLFFKFGAFAGLIQLIIIYYVFPILQDYFNHPGGGTVFMLLIGAAWLKLSGICGCISLILLLFIKWTPEKKYHKFTKITDIICWFLFMLYTIIIGFMGLLILGSYLLN